MAGEEYPKMYLYKRVVQAKLFIDNHYSDRLDLDNIADEARFSKFHFIRLFKSIYGKTPHHYLTQVRMEKAKEFLSNQMSVAATCTSVGFDSPTSFTALFKKKIRTITLRFSAATTPAQYRYIVVSAPVRTELLCGTLWLVEEKQFLIG